jgi:hypothetical protein
MGVFKSTSPSLVEFYKLHTTNESNDGNNAGCIRGKKDRANIKHREMGSAGRKEIKRQLLDNKALSK